MFLVFILLLGISFGSMGIEEALKEALKNNLELKALEKKLKAFEGRELKAIAFPNPELNFESGFITTTDSRGAKGKAVYIAEYFQPIPLWGVREKKREVVLKEKEAFFHYYEQRKKELMGKVYAEFFRSLHRKEILEIKKEELRIAKELEDFVRKSYEMGTVTPLEVLRAERERKVIEMELKIAQKEYRASLKELSVLIGKDVEEVDGDFFKVGELKIFSPEISPLVESLKSKREALERGIALEKALAKPSLGLGLMLEDSEEGYYGIRVVASSEIPLFYRRKGEILEKTFLKESVGLLMEYEKRRIRESLKALQLRYEAIREELEKLEREIIPRAEEELKLAIKSYRLGTITLFELSDIRRRYYELESKRRDLMLELHLIYSRYLSLGGER